ncbi:MAG: hypothetical protein JW982_06295 [Spirochaetes bacterium]|nr:hypothetical protein [Spirochaetota bacterium]
MKTLNLKKSITILLLLSTTVIFSCAETSQKWTKSDFENYSKSKGKFEFKCFAIELNLKMGIVSENYLDSKYSVDVLPIREIKDLMEKKYSTVIDISEFEKNRKAGNLKSEVLVAANKKIEVKTNPDFVTIDGASMNTGLVGRYAISGTSWLAVNWSEYKEKVKAMDFRYKTEKGKTGQMQIFTALAPVGSFIKIWLRVRDGEPDEKGYYKLKIVAEEKFPVNFKVADSNTAGLAENIKQLPELLKATML